jgi:hypothetical protein
MSSGVCEHRPGQAFKINPLLRVQIKQCLGGYQEKSLVFDLWFRYYYLEQ